MIHKTFRFPQLRAGKYICRVIAIDKIEQGYILLLDVASGAYKDYGARMEYVLDNDWNYLRYYIHNANQLQGICRLFGMTYLNSINDLRYKLIGVEVAKEARVSLSGNKYKKPVVRALYYIPKKLKNKVA